MAEGTAYTLEELRSNVATLRQDVRASWRKQGRGNLRFKSTRIGGIGTDRPQIIVVYCVDGDWFEHVATMAI